MVTVKKINKLQIREKVFVNNISDKQLVSRLYKELSKHNSNI